MGTCRGFWVLAFNKEELDQGHMSVDRNGDRSLSKRTTLSGWKWGSELDRSKPVMPCSPPASGPFMGSFAHHLLSPTFSTLEAFLEHAILHDTLVGMGFQCSSADCFLSYVTLYVSFLCPTLLARCPHGEDTSCRPEKDAGSRGNGSQHDGFRSS